MVASFLYAPVRNWVFIQERRGGMAQDTAGVMKIVREIGRIKEPGQITAMTATNLAFVDIDNNAVSFSQSGANLLRGADVLVRNVQSIAFTYLDASGAVAATASQVRFIRVMLVITSGNQTIRLESAARLRNYT
jgi:hypothetical protein